MSRREDATMRASRWLAAMRCNVPDVIVERLHEGIAQLYPKREAPAVPPPTRHRRSGR